MSVLLSSSGFVVIEHWCLMSGTKVETRLMPKECKKACRLEASCPQERAQSTVHKAPCCKEVARFEHVKTEQSNPSHSLPFSPVVSDLPDFAYVYQFLLGLLPTKWAISALDQPDDPLIRTGRSRLISLCIWLI